MLLQILTAGHLDTYFAITEKLNDHSRNAGVITKDAHGKQTWALGISTDVRVVEDKHVSTGISYNKFRTNVQSLDPLISSLNVTG